MDTPQNTALRIPAIPEEFNDIAPYNDLQFRQKMQKLVKEPGFEHAIRFIMPGVDYDKFAAGLTSIPTQEAFQSITMRRFLEDLEKSTTAGITMDGLENIDRAASYTYISNHRDIVLDASFLNLSLLRHNMPCTQIAIGNNLLIYDWITDLVKLNRSFIVKRDVKMVKALEAAKLLSAYIHYVIGTEHESVWIAQREGRAKDSNDLTQESLVKMLSLAGDGDVKANIMAVNLCPVSISYEFDPNDYLKVREFLLKRRDPEYKKSQRDDLFSMETGLLKYKGRVHFHLGGCINPELAKFNSDNRLEIIREACRLIDRQIHCGYQIYPGNYIAYDQLNGNGEFADRYTAADVEKFDKYISGQLDLVDEPDITAEERRYMHDLMLGMYANPLKNKLAGSCQRVAD